MIIEGTGGWKHKPCSAYRPEDEARCANEATHGDLCSSHAYLFRRQPSLDEQQAESDRHQRRKDALYKEID